VASAMVGPGGLIEQAHASLPRSGVASAASADINNGAYTDTSPSVRM
jgi:hypothetical protein